MSFKVRIIVYVLIIGALIILKATKSEKKDILQDRTQEPVENKMEWSAPEILPIEDIWKIEDKETFFYQMWLHILEKGNYGDNIQELNTHQRVFYVIRTLHDEVNNGGFAQYFYNSGGNFANEAVSAFESIGAYEIAKVCEKAVSIYGDSVPVDREERESVLLKNARKAEKILVECDEEFFECEDTLDEMIYQFIINNKESFLD